MNNLTAKTIQVIEVRTGNHSEFFLPDGQLLNTHQRKLQECCNLKDQALRLAVRKLAEIVSAPTYNIDDLKRMALDLADAADKSADFADYY